MKAPEVAVELKGFAEGAAVANGLLLAVLAGTPYVFTTDDVGTNGCAPPVVGAELCTGAADPPDGTIFGVKGWACALACGIGMVG